MCDAVQPEVMTENTDGAAEGVWPELRLDSKTIIDIRRIMLGRLRGRQRGTEAVGGIIEEAPRNWLRGRRPTGGTIRLQLVAPSCKSVKSVNSRTRAVGGCRRLGAGAAASVAGKGIRQRFDETRLKKQSSLRSLCRADDGALCKEMRGVNAVGVRAY